MKPGFEYMNPSTPRGQVRSATLDSSRGKWRGALLWPLLLAAWPEAARAQIVLPASTLEISVDEESGVFTTGRYTWLDATQHGLHRFIWKSARTIDSWVGPALPPEVYQEASGSVALGISYDEFDGIDPKARFHLDLPLPQVNKRVRLFIGRVNRDEYVTERNEPSGAFPQWQSGGAEEDQTLAGLVYLQPEKNGGSFGASIGARVRSSALDPYAKASYRYRRTLWGDTLFVWKETLFYQMSEKFGLTSRVDFERLLGEKWHLRWTGSVTFSEGTNGVRGFSNLTFTQALPGRQALIYRLGIEADTEAEVPLEEFGVKVAYRRSIVRDWLVLELRTSLTWPRDLAEQPRAPSWGFGIGCEMLFGDETFSSKPVTF